MYSLLPTGLLFFLAGCGVFGLEPIGIPSDTGAAASGDGDDGPYGGDTEIGDDGDGDGDGDGSGGGSGSSSGSSSGGGSGGSSPEENAPVLSTFTVVWGGGQLTATFKLSDADGDLEGGELDLTIAGSQETYQIPGDLDTFSDGGSSSLTIEGISAPDCGDQSIAVQAQAFDAAGNGSNQASDTETLTGEGTALSETGNAPTSVTSVGVATFPLRVCGNVYQASNNGLNSYTGDLDYFSFRPSTGGNRTVFLSWDGSSTDLDVFLLDGSLMVLQSAVSATMTPAREEVSHYLSASTDYVVVVAAWEGAAVDYEVVVE